MAVIDDKNLKNFIETNVNEDFGLSIETLADKVVGIGRFDAWLNNNKNDIKDVLQAVKDSGVSPAFFSAYEKTEGYNSKWGWLNHTSPAGNPKQDARSVSNWIVNQSKDMSSKPAWIDYANYNDFVPNDVKQQGNEHFASISSGSIGRVVIAGTAAGTWEVYYPKGLKKEYNGVQDYGKPITNMMNTIQEWGGNIGGTPYFIFPTIRNVTSGFRTPDRPDHHGVDFSDGQAHNIHAVADGVVTRSYLSDTYGEAVFIKHEINGQTWESVYAHMKSGSRTVSEGDTVKQGDVLGIMGNTGDSTGIHLHFELHKGRWNASKSNAVDPLDYLGKGSDNGDDGNDKGKRESQYITLLLVDAINGWKW